MHSMFRITLLIGVYKSLQSGNNIKKKKKGINKWDGSWKMANMVKKPSIIVLAVKYLVYFQAKNTSLYICNQKKNNKRNTYGETVPAASLYKYTWYGVIWLILASGKCAVTPFIHKSQMILKDFLTKRLFLKKKKKQTRSVVWLSTRESTYRYLVSKDIMQLSKRCKT